MTINHYVQYVQHDEPGDVQQRRGHVAGAPAGQTQHHHRARQDGGGQGNWKLRRMEDVEQLESINETIFKRLKPSCDFTYFLHFTFQVEPNEICVIQQGIRFSVAVEGPTRGYILEVDYQSVWI